jgi:hypothetical protein
MKENNEIEKLWRDFHTNLKVAREEQNHVCFLFLAQLFGTKLTSI